MGKTRGFTLVELAIVLVIIGIILGAILKGQELLNNSRAKRLQNDLRGLEAAIWTFYDRFGKFPGDCDGNGTVNNYLSPTFGATYSSSPTSPSSLCDDTDQSPDYPFDDLRYSRILSPNTPNNVLARHIFNGYFAIGHNGTPGYNAIAVYGVPNWVARMIDVSIDGTENGTVGRIQRWDNSTDWPPNLDEQVTLIYYFDKM